jgi:hypothetical protein
MAGLEIRQQSLRTSRKAIAKLPSVFSSSLDIHDACAVCAKLLAALGGKVIPVALGREEATR